MLSVLPRLARQITPGRAEPICTLVTWDLLPRPWRVMAQLHGEQRLVRQWFDRAGTGGQNCER